jgi:hypothetical protein
MLRSGLDRSLADLRHARLFALIHQQARADYIARRLATLRSARGAAPEQTALLARAEQSFDRPSRR